MAEVSVRSIEDKAEWEGFMAAHPEANFLHSWYWGEFHQRLNHEVERRGFYDGSKLIGIVQAIAEPARRGRHIVVPGGPILNWQSAELVKAWVAEIKKIATAHRCVFVRVRPQLLDTPENRHLFRRLGFHPSPMHVTADLTSQLDLTKSDDEIKKAMRKGARYDLNRSAKLGIEVTSTKSDEYLDEFYDLQLQTAERQGFVPFSKKFLSEQFARLRSPTKY